MKKNNVIIFTILAICSGFLLWLWYYLGLNRIDEPLDLVISIIWWVMIAAAIFAIVKIEQKRKERIRVVYVSKTGSIYNAESGRIAVAETANLLEIVSSVLQDLKYDFNRADVPSKEEFNPSYIIRTSKIDENSWEGELVDTWSKQKKSFTSKEELSHLVAEQELK